MIPHRVALRWLGEAGSALDAAHEAGIVHRDVKPANMLLDDKGRLALADFGIARLGLEDQITQTGQVLGTAAYISPEQAMGEPSTAASDRYALAVVAFELLTGSKPFSGGELRRPGARPRRGRAAARVRARRRRPARRRPRAGARHGQGARGPLGQRRRDGARARRRARRAAAAPPRRRARPRRDARDGRHHAARDRPAPPRAPRRPARPRRGLSAGAVVALAALLLVAAGAIALVTRGRRSRARPSARQEQTPTATPDATTTPAGGDPHGHARRDRGAGRAGRQSRQRQRQGEGQGEEVAGRRRRPGGAPGPGVQPQQRRPAPTRRSRYAQKAVELCQGSDAVDPCAYALYEYARALRMTGDPEGAIAALEERKQRFPDDQPDAVERELALAREAAGERLTDSRRAVRDRRGRDRGRALHVARAGPDRLRPRPRDAPGRGAGAGHRPRRRRRLHGGRAGRQRRRHADDGRLRRRRVRPARPRTCSPAPAWPTA